MRPGSEQFISIFALLSLKHFMPAQTKFIVNWSRNREFLLFSIRPISFSSRATAGNSFNNLSMASSISDHRNGAYPTSSRLPPMLFQKKNCCLTVLEGVFTLSIL